MHRTGNAHLRRALAAALAAAALSPFAAVAQGTTRPYYLSLSRSVAVAFGRTWQLGKQCDIALDGLSRAAAARLFSRRLEEEEVSEVLGAYDKAAESATAQPCERGNLPDQVNRADQALRRYLQVPPPLNRMEFSSPPSRLF